MADVITNKEAEELPIPIKRGIELHRLIDSYTDNHPDVSKVNLLLHQNHHKYAPVISDVLFDYTLAYNWDQFGTGDLDTFAKNIYRIIKENIDFLPQRKQKMVHNMIADNFLLKYTTFEGLEFVFEKMTKRVRFKSNFHLAVDDLKLHFSEINAHFISFFPDLKAEVISFCNC